MYMYLKCDCVRLTAVPCIAAMRGCVVPVIRSMLSKRIPADKQGQCSASLAVATTGSLPSNCEGAFSWTLPGEQCHMWCNVYYARLPHIKKVILHGLLTVWPPSHFSASWCIPHKIVCLSYLYVLDDYIYITSVWQSWLQAGICNMPTCTVFWVLSCQHLPVPVTY